MFADQTREMHGVVSNFNTPALSNQYFQIKQQQQEQHGKNNSEGLTEKKVKNKK